jgi:TrmH family RNA methyltransferase
MKITSPANPRIKNILKLTNARVRKAEGLVLVDGAAEVRRALDAGVPLREFYVCREWLKDDDLPRTAERLGASVYEVSPRVCEKLAFGDRKEGVVAVCAPRPAPWPVPRGKKAPLFLVVERVEKPGNLGAVLRTCDGVGVDGVLVCDPRTDIFNPNCIRASLGAVFSLPVVQAAGEDVLRFLRGQHVRVVASAPSATGLYTSENLAEGVALVVGGEHEGLSDFWLREADALVRIPMLGKIDSLNVSVSSAVLLYEALRQRRDRR